MITISNFLSNISPKILKCSGTGSYFLVSNSVLGSCCHRKKSLTQSVFKLALHFLSYFFSPGSQGFSHTDQFQPLKNIKIFPSRGSLHMLNSFQFSSEWLFPSLKTPVNYPLYLGFLKTSNPELISVLCSRCGTSKSRILKRKKNYQKGRVRETKKKRQGSGGVLGEEVAHFLVHSTHGHDGWAWVRLMVGAGSG